MDDTKEILDAQPKDMQPIPCHVSERDRQEDVFQDLEKILI